MVQIVIRNTIIYSNLTLSIILDFCVILIQIPCIVLDDNYCIFILILEHNMLGYSMCPQNSSENCIEFLLVIVVDCQINDRPDDESKPWTHVSDGTIEYRPGSWVKWALLSVRRNY